MNIIKDTIFIFIVLLTILNIKQINAVGSVSQIKHPRVSVMSQGLRSFYTFFFKVDTSIAAGNYIKLKFNHFVDITPQKCVLSLNSLNTWQDVECSTIGLTNELFIELPEALENTYTENALQIDLQNINPIDSQSQSFEIWTVSDKDLTNFFIYDLNLNFGQIPFSPVNNEELQVEVLEFGTDITKNKPEALNNLRIAIQINEQIGDDELQAARIKISVTSPWKFSTTSEVNSEKDPRYDIINPLTDIEGKYLSSDLYKKPEISYFEIETPTQISIVFSEDFKPGRSFILEITDIQNPPNQSTGVIKIYSMEFNSNIVVEKKENIMDLEIFYNIINSELVPPSNVPFVGPVGFYKNTKQFIRIKFSPENDVAAGQALKVDFGSTNIVIKGTGYLDPSIQPNDPTKPILFKYVDNFGGSSSYFTVENLSALTANTEYYVQVKINTSKSDANISAKVQIDYSTTTINPLFYGETANINLKTNSQSSLTSIQGSGSVNDIIEINQTAGTTEIVIDIFTTTIDTDNSSVLEIYTTNDLTQGSGFTTSSCFVSGPTSFNVCTITTTTDYSKIRLESGAGADLLSGAVTVTIQDLGFTNASNYQDLVYEFYFRLYKTSNVNAPVLDWIATPILINDEETDFTSGIMNDLFQINNYLYPNLINLVSKSNTALNFPKVTNEKKVITLWGHEGFKSLVYQPTSQESFSCGSNLQGIECEFIEGDDKQETTNYLSWNHINVYLQGEALQEFHVIIPEIFLTSSSKLFEVTLGTYNTVTRQFRYIKKQPQFSTGLLNLLDDNNQNTNSKITLAGYAGQPKDNVSLEYTLTAFDGNDGTDFGAAIILITDWEMWVQGSSEYQNTAPNNANTDFSFLDDMNAPVTLMYYDALNIQHFINVFPITGTSITTTGGNILIDNLLIPFSYDLPNHNFYITDKTGVQVEYSRYFNQGSNWFYGNYLLKLDMSCDYLSEGILNTFCTIIFQNQYNIQSNAVIQIDFVGLNVFTDQCAVSYESTPGTFTTIESATCQMNLSADQMIIKFNENNLLPYGIDYQISFYGAEIKQQLQKYINLSVRDKSGNFVIEEKQKIITSTIFNPIYIEITEISYREINPYVFSSLFVKFTTPRTLYPNEEVAFDMGTDLNDVNTNTARLSVQLFKLLPDDSEEEVKIAVNFSAQKMNVLFFDRTQFTGSDYRLEINNTRNPSSNGNDYFKILFVRVYDSSLVLQNIPDTTAPFPGFIDKTNSDITLLEANYLQEGALQELVVRITMQNSKIDSLTKIYINFPIYYSPALTDFDDHLFCLINNIQITCITEPNQPYRLVVSNSPLSIHQGEPFILKIFGIVTPQYTQRYLGDNTQETLFIGLNSGKGDQFYTEYIHLQPPAVSTNVLNSEYVYLQYVDIPIKFSGSLSDHTLKFQTDGNIPANSGILIIFPKEYSTLIITSQLDCYIRLEDGSTTDEQACPVEGNTLKLETGSEIIPEDTAFYIVIKDVPTPPNDGEIDMNQIVIQVFDTNKDIITRNFYLTNRMQIVTFESLQNILQINDGQIITVTKGSYSKPIFITTPDETRYITNLQINTQGEGFQFLPQQLSVFLGDHDTNLRIGAHKNLQEKAYQFEITMEEKYWKEYYNIANTYVIFVTSIPSPIVIPQTIDVAIGGCSLPYTLQLENSPYNDLEIAIQYDYSQYPEQVFFLDLELSSYILKYNQDVNYRYLSFCITSDYDPSNSRRNLSGTPNLMNVGLHLGGQNSQSYNLQLSQIDLNIISKTKIAPTLELTENLVKRTSFVANVNIPTDGVLYWHLYVKNSAQPLSLNQIKFLVKYQNNILQSSTDSQDNVNGIKIDERVGFQVYRQTDPTSLLEVKGLQPETDYQLCAFFENEFKEATEQQTCIQFLTTDWDFFTKTSIKFTQKSYEDNLNEILCFYVKEVKTRIFNIVEASGISCSFGVSPDFSYYRYQGTTYSANAYETNVYLIPDLEIETDIALTTLEGFYDPTTKEFTANFIQQINDKYGIDFIESGKYIKQFKYSDATSATGDFRFPSITSQSYQSVVTSTEASIHIKGLQLSGDGAVYFILERINFLQWDPIQEEYYTFPIGVERVPSAQNVVSCLNAFDTKAQRCIRAVVTNGQSVDALFEDLLFESGYNIYYVLANEYPLNPIYSDTVQQMYVEIGSKPNKNSSQIKYFQILGLLIMSFILF